MMAGMAYLPENRKEEGIIADLSVRENIIIALQAKRGMFHLLSRKEQEEFTDKYIDLLQIKTADRETPIKQLSGGNSAEDNSRKMASDRTGFPDPRRADKRYRHRNKDRDTKACVTACRAGYGGYVYFI